MPGGIEQVEVLVCGRGSFAQPHFNLGCAAGWNIHVIETPFPRINAGHIGIRRHFSRFHPRRRDVAVPNTIPVQILERFARIPGAIAVTVSKWLEASAVTTLNMRGNISPPPTDSTFDLATIVDPFAHPRLRIA